MRRILMTEENVDSICELIRKQFIGAQVTGANFSVSVPTTIPLQKEERPNIIISQVADRKMKALIQKCTDEVAWHGVVDYDPETLTYIISDILVFPQEVTSGTAVSVDEAYGPWMMSLPEDIFRRVRFHGHSHVYMAVNPSGTDLTYQETLTKQVTDFYIFAIYNKRDEYNFWIYDKVNNLLYEKADIDIDAELLGTEAWAERQLANMVKKKSYATGQTTKPATQTTAPSTSTSTNSKKEDTTTDATTNRRNRDTKDNKQEQLDLESGYWKPYNGRLD